MDALLFITIVVPLSWVLFFVGLVVPAGARVVFWAYRAILILLSGLFLVAVFYGALMALVGVLGMFEQKGQTNIFLFLFACMYFAITYFGHALCIFGSGLSVVLIAALLRGTYKLAGWVDRLPEPRQVKALRKGRLWALFRIFDRLLGL